MKYFVFTVVCLFGNAMSQHWGRPQPVGDTPEVSAAKSAHLAAVAKAHQQQQQHSWSGIQDDGSYKPEHQGETSWSNDESSWTPQAHSWSPQSHSWTPQPQQWEQQVPQHHLDAPQKKWTGPVALPPGFDKNGAPPPVLDTPEVVAEKSKHFHLYAHGAYAAAVTAPTSPAYTPNWHP